MLCIKNIVKKFPGVTALNDVSLDIERGSVHALLGENGAGKSTLVKIICGMYRQDAGEIFYDGKLFAPQTPHDAIEAGIRVVYQELNLLSYLSVAENIFFDRLPRKNGFLVDFEKLYSDTERVLKLVGLDISPKTPIELLGVAQMQLVEIAKALSSECRVLVLDEPTATLSPRDTSKLFEIIKNLKSHGLTVIYISHHLKEIYEICDTLTVLRNGEVVGSSRVGDIKIPQIVSMMVGRTMESEYPFFGDVAGDDANPAQNMLEVRGLRFAGNPHEVSFCVKRGELLGVSGLVGSKRTETVRAIFGADPVLSGEVFVNGRRAEIKSPQDAVRAGLSLLTEDRKNQGLVLDMPLSSNTTLAALDAVSHAGLLDDARERELTENLVNDLSIKTPSVKQFVRNLSGGNQQKVVIAKWLLRDSQVLIFDEPTRGIDVGAKYEIYLLLWKLLEMGKGILLVSSDLNELMGICHRIIVFSNGRITGDIARENFRQEKILECAYQEYIKVRWVWKKCHRKKLRIFS